MFEAAGIKEGTSSILVVIISGVGTDEIAALDCRVGTKGANVLLVAKGSNSLMMLCTIQLWGTSTDLRYV